MIYVPQYLIRKIAESEDFLNGDPLKAIQKSIDGCNYPVTFLERYFGNKLKTLKILEIGSGNGFSLCHALLQGLDIVGIEPGAHGFEGRYTRAIELLRLNDIDNPKSRLFNAAAESLPFKRNTFDVVFSVAVLEHVKNLDTVMSEAMRVLKPVGMFWANVPNYNSVWEGHYKMLWMPHMSKTMAKRYVEFRGRDAAFIDTLNFTTPKMFKGQKFLYGRGFLNYIFSAYNFCVEPRLIPDKYKWFSKFKFLKYPLFVCVKILEALGQGVIFDVVIRK